MFASPETAGTTSPSRATMPIAVVLILWLALVLLLGAKGAFAGPPGAPPLPLLAGFLTPLIAFTAAYWAIGSFRDFVLSLDLRFVAGIQAWRFAGLEFLALSAHGVLPGFFAWPAGLGDMAIGITAPWVILALIRRPSFASSSLFVVWNLLGILDLVDAMSLGAVGSILTTGGAGAVTTAPMAQLPLLLIPAYFVPVFFMLHFAALLQARQRQVAERTLAQPARESHIAA
ncbi:MAG TPA: hypothetical protein VKU00_05475 [Chthonomonadaceae bacterium]|nr:hypothetical protein [Chthonomonadaceae bacterium]